MSKNQRKLAKKRPDLSKTDAKIMELVKQDPMASNYEIGKQLNKLGVSKSDHAVYNRLKQSQYLSREIDQIRQANFEMMSREVVPEALKIHKRVLKNKGIPDEKKKDWVALAEKAEFGTDELKRPPQPQPQVNLIAIQQIIQQAINMPPDDKDVIGITEG